MDKIKIAITGGIGSGKSTALEYVKGLGYDTFSCDEIYKQICATDEYGRALAQAFPNCVQSGEIDRQKLSALVFSDKAALKRLNELSHGRIMAALHDGISKAKTELVFAEVPLLFEGGYETGFDYVIVIMRDIEKRVKSICERNNISAAEALSRINNQWDYDNPQNRVYLQNEKFISLWNNLDVSHLELELQHVVQRIMKQ